MWPASPTLPAASTSRWSTNGYCGSSTVSIGGTVPPITVVPTGDRDVLFSVARAATANLEEYPVDKLELAICLSMLEAVRPHRRLDRSRHRAWRQRKAVPRPR